MSAPIFTGSMNEWHERVSYVTRAEINEEQGTQMTLDENKRLILDHYEAFVHRQDAETVRAQLAEDFVDHEMPPGTPAGPEAVLRWGEMLHRAFPIVAEGDRVAVRAAWKGTHLGEFPLLRIAPTNRSVVFTGMVLWRISGNKIVERWATLDRLGLQKQLGAASI